MRHRDRWEQWLRAEITSLPLQQGVDVATAWAVASMLATYANADGSGITVSTNTIRIQLKSESLSSTGPLSGSKNPAC
jgi:hypothetical protein